MVGTPPVIYLNPQIQEESCISKAFCTDKYKEIRRISSISICSDALRLLHMKNLSPDLLGTHPMINLLLQLVC